MLALMKDVEVELLYADCNMRVVERHKVAIVSDAITRVMDRYGTPSLVFVKVNGGPAQLVRFRK